MSRVPVKIVSKKAAGSEAIPFPFSFAHAGREQGILAGMLYKVHFVCFL